MALQPAQQTKAVHISSYVVCGFALGYDYRIKGVGATFACLYVENELYRPFSQMKISLIMSVRLLVFSHEPLR